MDLTIDVELTQEDFDLITKYARVAFKKIRKPSTHTLEDLEQEGHIAFISAFRKYKETYKASRTTFTHLLLKNHFRDIIVASYQKPVMIFEIEDLSIFGKSFLSPSRISGILSGVGTLNTEEKTYLTTLLNPPKQLALDIQKNGRGKRGILRKFFNICSDTQKQMENNIKHALLTV